MIIPNIQPVVDRDIMKLCVTPYHGHKKGCPNYNKRKGCPPKTPLFSDGIDMTQPMYLIYNRFKFGEHVERMREKHPDWSKRQLECCLYWQGTARKRLREEINEFWQSYSINNYAILTIPEAYGVNVTATMKTIGINLEWPPVKYAYQVAIAGYPSDKYGFNLLSD